MSCGISCGFNSGFLMLSVKQCMKKTIMRNKDVLLYSELKNIKKTSTCLSLAKFSDYTSNQVTLKRKWEANDFIKHDCLVPMGFHSFHNKNNKEVEKCKTEEKSEVKVSLYQKLKKMYKEYWYVLIPVHLVTSSFWFGGFYYLAACGIDIPALLETVGAPESWIENLRNSKAGNIVLAYTLYKVATPARYAVTLGGTTISINYLKKWGWIKPVPNKEQFRKMYEEKKGAFSNLKASYQDKMQVTKNEFLKTKNEMKQQCNEAKLIFHKSVKETRNDFREVKEGFKENAKESVEELKIFNKVVTRNLKEGWQGIFSGKK